MTTATTLPWALAGFGSGGRIFHAPLIAAAPGIDFTAIVTGHPDRRADAAAHYPATAVVGALRDLPDLGVAGVTISTPPATHLPLAIEALRAGLHVVVDKPVGRTADELRELARVAAESARLVIPYQNRRWDDDFRTVQRLVNSGRLGDIVRFESRLDRHSRVKPGWSNDPTAGGGLLLDLGPHLIDQAVTLLGPVADLAATLRAVRPGAVAEDDVMIQLRHESGALSVLSASLAAPVEGPRFLVQGTRAGARIEGFDIQEAQLKAGGSPASLGPDWGRDPGRHVTVTAGNDSTTEPLERGAWDTFYPAVAAAVTTGAAPPVNLADAATTAGLIDRIRSAATARHAG